MTSPLILVTGADGFIGSHLTEYLVRQGLNVRAFVHYNSFNSWGWLDHSATDIRNCLNVFSGDIRDPHGVRHAMQGCEIVFHLAALVAIPYSYHSPASYVETNVQGTLNLLQAAVDLGVSRFVHTSTSEVYGTAQFIPISENHPLNAQSPYAATKIAADQLALSYHRTFSLPVSIVRPFNTFGPRQSARAVIPTIITQLLAGKTNIKLGAVRPTRDFNFVTDVIKGFRRISETHGALGEVINIGSNFEISIGNAAKLIADVIGIPIEIETDEDRLRPEASEVDRLWADNAKAAKLANWRPDYAGLAGFRNGIVETVEWFSDETNLRLYKEDIYNI